MYSKKQMQLSKLIIRLTNVNDFALDKYAVFATGGKYKTKE